MDDDATLEPATPPVEPIVRRPDGYYWVSEDTHQEFGPFASYEDALSDLHAADPAAPDEPSRSLREAEDAIGIAGWIDPETGEPAEGPSPPHFEQD